ncbi:hypothetical protein FACS1894217_12440 [Clostridia bacterium]|nr:hypothetical protein FACS1894217_12440 [Clostridia bacterium]
MKRFFAIAVAVLLTAALIPFSVTAADAVEVFAPVGFEDGTVMGFTNRASENDPEETRDKSVVEATKEEAHNGEYSLKITERTKEWNGTMLHIEQYVEPNAEYDFTVWVKSPSPAAVEFHLSTQGGASGPYSYIANATKTADDGWFKMSGSFTMGADESWRGVYVETVGSLTDFYIDDLTIIKSGGVSPDLTLKPLKEVYASDFVLGAAATATQVDNTDIIEFIKHHYSIITFGNEMKPNLISTAKDQYDFTAADKMLETLTAAGLKIHAHTLVWHQQSPDWLNVGLTRAEAKANLEKYISTVAGHFKGKVVSWDVVNEAVDDATSKLRTNAPWYVAYANGATGDESGEDYIYDAFKFARAADPDAILYYNEYNMDNAAKADGVLAVVKAVNDKWKAEGGTGLLVQGIGLQAHDKLLTNASDEAATIEKIIAAGMEFSITELDVETSTDEAGIPEIEEQAQAVKYAELFQVYRKYGEHAGRITIWGLGDNMDAGWLYNKHALPFNKDLTAKTAYTALLDPDKFLLDASRPSTTKLANVKFGTPVIDGDIDAVWKWDATTDDDKPLDINTMLQAWDVQSGKFKLLWDQDNLYVLATARNAEDNPLAGIEFFIDEGGEKSETYDANDRWFRVGMDGTLTGSDTTGVEAKVKQDGKDYTVELKIPFQKKDHAGADVLGFDARVTAAIGDAVQGRSVWNDTTGKSEESAAYLGEAMLYATIAPVNPGIVFVAAHALNKVEGV